MRIKKRAVKVIIGIITVLMVLLPFTAGRGFAARSITPGIPVSLGRFDLIFHPEVLCFWLAYLGLMIFYLILVIRNTLLTDYVRLLFVLGMLFVPFLAMPIYFVAYYWKGDTSSRLARVS